MSCCCYPSNRETRMSIPVTVADSDDFVEDVVCAVNDIEENQMKIVELKGEKVLLVKQHGKISAIGTKCPHYGAPLVNGALGEGRIRCQLHGACFSLETGDIEDFPTHVALPCYKVTIENDKVKVRAKMSELLTNKRIKPMSKRNNDIKEKIVVIGGGPSSSICVETLRQEGFRGEIVLICKENHLPYDRPKVSKELDFDITKAQFRDDKFYKDNDIDVIKGVGAASLDTATNTVTLENGNKLKYDKLYIATGSTPQKPNVPGSESKNVIVLKYYEDAKYANSQLNEDKDVVIIGASFVGMEAANYCVGKAKSVTIIGRGAVPFRSVWKEKIGAAILKLFEKNGVKYISNSGLKKIHQNEKGEVSSVELIDGGMLKCDILFCGLGNTYSTDFLKGSGINLMPDGSIETDEFLQTNVPNVFVGGEIACSPVWCNNNIKEAVGYFAQSHTHGKHAALKMLNKPKPLRIIPHFTTILFGKCFRHAGHGEFDVVIYNGDVDALKFIAFFLNGEEVVAVTSCDMDPLVSLYTEKLAQGKKLYRNDIKDDPLAWTK